MSPFSLNG